MDGQSVSYSFGYAHQEKRTFRTFRSYNTMAAFVWSLWKASLFSISSSWHGSFSKVSFMIVTFFGNGFNVGEKIKGGKKNLKSVWLLWFFDVCIIFKKCSHEMSNVEGLIQDMKAEIASLEASIKMISTATHWTVDLGAYRTKRRYQVLFIFLGQKWKYSQRHEYSDTATFFILFWLNTYCSLWLYFSFLLKFIYSRFLPIFAS